MSKIAISGASTGTATFTIESPATSTNRTLTLPDNTGTIITQNSTPAFASTIGVGGATAAASGAGITFPATQSASSNANTLDDYEEGTWTPVFTGTVSNPTLTYSGGSPWGLYTKVGNVVSLAFELRTTARSGGSGDINITGLPFTSVKQFVGAAAIYNIDLDSTTKYVISYLNSTLIRFDQAVDNGVSIALPVSAWSTGSLCLINATITYTLD